MKLDKHLNTKTLLIVVISLQFLVCGSILLDYIGIKIAILRQILSFVFLFFVPGFLITKILKLNGITTVEKVLYSTGLSISFLMIVGFLLNFMLPFFGILNPISLKPLIIFFNISVLFLCCLYFLTEKNQQNSVHISVDTREIFSKFALPLYIMPLLAILGTYFVNYHQNNLFLLLSILLICITCLLIVNLNVFPQNLYPLALFSISISLLFHNSLISPYIFGWDIQKEYYISNLVINNSYWNSAYFANLNAMLSLVMVAPIFKIISGMDLVWVFKIVYPLLFSLVPVGIYCFFQKQNISPKISFLSVFFFVSLVVFYREMLHLLRQEIAELFLVLILILSAEKNMHEIGKKILLIVFIFSLAVSHYSLNYIFFSSVIVVCLLTHLYFKYINIQSKNNVTFSFVLLYFTLMLSWYMYISSSSAFGSIILIIDNIMNSFITDFMDPNSAQGLALIINNKVSGLHLFAKLLQLFYQICIFIGLFDVLLFKNKLLKFDSEYIAYSCAFFIILVAALVVPHFASSMNTARLYHISLIFLSPYCIFGWNKIYSIIIRPVKYFLNKEIPDHSLSLLSISLVVFLLFNCGFIYELAKDNPDSISISNNIDYPIFFEQDLLSSKWIYAVRTNEIYADTHRLLLFTSFTTNYVRYIQENNTIANNSYIYLGSFNILSKNIMIAQMHGTTNYYNYIPYISIVCDDDKIYSNGKSQVYAVN